MSAIQAFCANCKRPILSREKVHKRVHTRYISPHGQPTSWTVTMCKSCARDEAAWTAQMRLADVVVHKAMILAEQARRRVGVYYVRSQS
jgi:RNase P subunit RPR2